MGNRVAGKVAIITGSSGGMGEGIARCLAAEGAAVHGRDGGLVWYPGILIANTYRAQVTKYAHPFKCDPAARAGMVPVEPAAPSLADVLNDMVKQSRIEPDPVQEPTEKAQP